MEPKICIFFGNMNKNNFSELEKRVKIMFKLQNQFKIISIFLFVSWDCYLLLLINNILFLK